MWAHESSFISAVQLYSNKCYIPAPKPVKTRVLKALSKPIPHQTSKKYAGPEQPQFNIFNRSIRGELPLPKHPEMLEELAQPRSVRTPLLDAHFLKCFGSGVLPSPFYFTVGMRWIFAGSSGRNLWYGLFSPAHATPGPSTSLRAQRAFPCGRPPCRIRPTWCT